MKFLIIRFSSIGDIILTTPVIRCLKKQVPGAEVHMVTRQAFRDILASNPYIDKLHLLKDNLSETIGGLKEEAFDYIIDLHHNIRSLKVKRALGVKSFSFNKLNIEKFIYTNFKVNLLPPVHIVDRNLDTLKTFGVKKDGEGLDYFIPLEDEIADSDLPLPHRQAYVGLVIGAALPTKRLPVHKLQALCNSLDFPIILLGGPEDRETGELIAAVNPERVFNACGKFNLNESAALVKKAELIITHDTGLMHIAAAFKKPIISIWGNTVPAFGMAPYYGKYNIRHCQFEVNGLNCRPCSKIGYKKCPRGHFKCMKNQNVQSIVLTALEILLAK